MKKVIFLICITCFAVLLTSCGLFRPRYSCESGEVISIQIVMLEGVDEVYNFKYTVLHQVSDIETFANCLNDIPYSTNWGDPYPIKLQNVAIRIEYSNGDCELLQSMGQSIRRVGKEDSGGYYHFDDEKFEELIYSYVNREEFESTSTQSYA